MKPAITFWIRKDSNQQLFNPELSLYSGHRLLGLFQAKIKINQMITLTGGFFLCTEYFIS